MNTPLDPPLPRRLLLGGTLGRGAAALGRTRAHGATGTALFADGLTLPPADEALTPFRVAVRPGAIADLKARLRHTCWPEREPMPDWSQGVPLARARQIVAFWADRPPVAERWPVAVGADRG